MEARIRKDELKTFLEQARTIPPLKNGLPILSYIKIDIVGDFATLTKTNLRTFLVKTISNDSEDCSFLVQENILNSFVEWSDNDYVNFRSESNRIKIYDQRRNTSSPTEPATGYPPFDISDKGWTVLPKSCLASVGIAGQLIMNGEIMNARSFVFIGDGLIGGTDGNVGYFQYIKEDLPCMSLRKEVTECISKMKSCKVSQNESFDLFQEDNCLWGFVQSEIQYINMAVLVGPPPIQTPSFNTNKNYFIKFGRHVANTQDKSASATFEVIDPTTVKLNMQDGKNEVDNDENIFVKNGTSGEMKFNPQYMTTLLNALPCEECYFHEGNKRFIITDADKSFMGIIMAII